ncbi:MAG TPA: type I-C CRISPR-associated protein Cas8c/Csd1 [Candidatus Limnocylindrales bacterium]|nr:type I-C CRISPR-associated protein Cas8c/Csd1 [Candidatus Limnocylindrales bacterium]
MFVQALAAYADEYLSEEMGSEAWEQKPVPYFIEIGFDGTFLGVVSRSRQEARGKATVTIAEPLTVPKTPLKRNSGLHPLLAADDIKYVLGPGRWTSAKDSDRENASERHRAFVDFIGTAAKATADEALISCVRFYERDEQVQRAREELNVAKAGSFVVLSVGGPVISRLAPRRYWEQHYRDAKERIASGALVAECLISGRVGPVAPTHDPIKGLGNVGGQPAGVALMSFDKAAFRSYGWDQCGNSPVSMDRAAAYVLALNDLLKSDSRRRTIIGGVAFVYWTKQPADFDPMHFLSAPDVKSVEALLRFDPEADPDPNEFYLAGLSANGARVMMRYWMAEPLRKVKANLKEWIEGLRIVGLNGQGAKTPERWQLYRAIDPDEKWGARRMLPLIRRAVEGRAKPLGYDMLSTVLRYLRHPPESKGGGETKKQELRFTVPRMALLRLCVNDVIKGGRAMTEKLDVGQDHPAYLCGRLLAEYENLQETVYRWAGEAKVNVTIADRYYSLASTNPKAAFPKVEALARNHFQKLRRDRVQAMIAIERTVADLHQRIGAEFPAVLDLDGQGRFALGFYHHKAERNARIAEFTRQNDSSSDTEKETAE